MFGNQYGVRTVTLNRPKKLNSLNGSMARKIVPRLQEWKKSQLANVVVIKGEGRALCAGGDVAALAQANQSGKEGQQSSKDYFALEYKLDHLIATYPKPYVAFMDGAIPYRDREHRLCDARNHHWLLPGCRSQLLPPQT
jgi:3-hydroxyisobutyryl-CoA hydrolase